MRRFLLLLPALLCSWSLAAQDWIVKSDDSRIEAKVLEISQDAVRYKRFSNPDGPTYVVPIADVRYIEYPNGERDTFSAPAPKPETEPVQHTATEESAARTTYKRTYAVGDYYNEAGVEGVVVVLPEGDTPGLVLSLQEVALHWDCFEKGDAREVGASSKSDGKANMQAVERYVAENNLNWEQFPAFDWCRKQGEGWYLPSIDEWLSISFHFNGGSRTTFNRAARNRINSTLKEHGGKRIDKMFYYYSSTEQDARVAFATHMEIEPPYVEPLKKCSGITYLVRAVHPFR